MRRLVALLLVLATCGGLSTAEFQKRVEEAAACAPGDTCVLAGQSQCTCRVPVNARNQAAIDADAKLVDCGGAIVSCIFFSNVRCENGKCVGDAGTGP